jgi:hypothetical protein
MQSKGGISRDGWPQEMVIVSEVNERALTELLFVRSAWGLDVASAIPEAEPAPAPTVNLTDTERSDLAVEWVRRWDVAVDWAAQSFQHGLEIQRLTSDLGRVDTEAVLRLAPPTWAEVTEDERFDRDAFVRWQSRLPEHTNLPVSKTPERRNIPALVEAWRHGLKTLVAVPVAGDYAEQIGDNALLFSHTTYADPALFAGALAGFRAV